MSVSRGMLPVRKMLSTFEFQQRTMYTLDHLFIADVLLLSSVKMSSELKCYCKLQTEERQYSAINAVELHTPELVEFLQQSALEHLTTYRQLEAQQFGPVAAIVTTDFEALYAYKLGDYQRCLQLSTQNAYTLLFADDMPSLDVWTFPVFLQLMDDDIVSLTALTLIVNPKSRGHSCNANISQLTLSLYLMTQCQLKLRHSVTALAKTLDYIKVAQRRHTTDRTLDHLTLKLTKRKVLMYLSRVRYRKKLTYAYASCTIHVRKNAIAFVGEFSGITHH